MTGQLSGVFVVVDGPVVCTTVVVGSVERVLVVVCVVVCVVADGVE